MFWSLMYVLSPNIGKDFFPRDKSLNEGENQDSLAQPIISLKLLVPPTNQELKCLWYRQEKSSVHGN